MRYVFLLLSIPLLSCTAAPQQPYNAAMPPGSGYATPPFPPAIRPASSRGGVVINYAGTGDGSRITVKLTSMAAGTTRAEGGVTGTGGGFCAGSFSGTGTLRGQTLIIRDETVPECAFTLTKAGRRLTVDEAPQCMPTHGSGCGFSGVLAQK